MTRRTLLQYLAALSAASIPNGANALGAPLVRPEKGDFLPSAFIQDGIDWSQFLARHDLTWQELPRQWEEGAFLGNGLLGAMIFQSEDGHSMRWHIGRSDVVDHGQRIPVGDLLLVPQGQIMGGTMRLDLWNAQASGHLKTDKGTIDWKCSTHAVDQVIIIEWQPSEGERGAAWKWEPGLATDPRRIWRKQPIRPEDINPDPTQERVGDLQINTQLLHDNRAHVVAWRESQSQGGRVLFLSVGYASPNGPIAPDALVANDVEAAKQQAIQWLNVAAIKGSANLERTHRDYWHNFYKRSFLSIPDTRLESFYWIQLYKMNSATRQGRPIIDLMGPWFRSTPWASIWWNLNIQLTYWPVYASNHLELGTSLIDTLDAHTNNLIANMPEAERADSAGIGRVTGYDLRGNESKELGNLPWVMHNYWLHLRHSMDETRMRDTFFPLLRRTTNVYLHRLQPGDDGFLHLPVAISPEYPKEAPDTNYDLALLRWSCITLLGLCERFHIDDPLKAKWQDTLARLTPAPTDENGLMIGRGVPFAESHRHFSHLFSIYPLHLLTPDTPANRALMEKSLDHWLGMPRGLAGYSYAGGSSMSSLLGRRDDAVRLLNVFADTFLKPNTMYTELGPVIETPFAAATSLQEIVLQSWETHPFDSTIRVFPGVPDSWRDVSFADFSAEGGFLVSAQKRDGQTQWVGVQSLAGEPCKLRVPLENPVQLNGTRPFSIQKQPDGTLLVDLKRGEEIVLAEAGTKPQVRITPVKAQENRLNYFGLRKVVALQPDARGQFVLPASQAIIRGTMLQYAADQNSLGRWTNLGDYAEWNVHIAQAATFRVIAVVGAPTSSAGSRFSVEATGTGGARLEADVPTTGGYLSFQEIEVGTLRLKAGEVKVRAKALTKTGYALMNLRAVKLLPLL